MDAYHTWSCNYDDGFEKYVLIVRVPYYGKIHLALDLNLVRKLEGKMKCVRPRRR